MAAIHLQELVDTLRKEESRLRAQHDTAQLTAKNLAAELHKVEKAIGVLLGQRTTRTTGKGKSESLNGEEVVLLIQRILEEAGPLKEPELKQKVNEIARMLGGVDQTEQSIAHAESMLAGVEAT